MSVGRVPVSSSSPSVIAKRIYLLFSPQLETIDLGQFNDGPYLAKNKLSIQGLCPHITKMCSR